MVCPPRARRQAAFEPTLREARGGRERSTHCGAMAFLASGWHGECSSTGSTNVRLAAEESAMGKKVILGLTVVVVAAIVVAIAMVASRLGGIAGHIIEDYGSATTGTDVSVRSVDVEPTRGRGEVKDLTIANPPGFHTDYALRIDDVELGLDLASLRKDVPVIREVLVDAAHLNAEQRGDSTNLTDIE